MRIVTIGRDNSCDIVVNDPHVSKIHANLFLNGDGQSFTFRDMSTNGTLINGVQVQKNDVHIRYGDSVLLAGRIPLPWSKINNYYYSNQMSYNMQAQEIKTSSPFNDQNIGNAKRPNNYMVASILVLLFGGIIWGAIALGYSNRVNKLFDEGDLLGAQKASNQAKTWCIVGVCVSVIFLLITVVSS